jgi:GNAT superfamily N-acetyltransferase
MKPMTMNPLSLQLARPTDCDDIRALMKRAIAELQKGYLTPQQIEASNAGMGLDTQLIADGTYFTVRDGATLVGCGGWSYRATLHGGDHSANRDMRALDPKTERARIRAMYTHPDHVKRGIGQMIISASESAAREHGFSRLEMAATMAGKPFYLRCGYTIESEWFDEHGAVPVPLATMIKSI